MIEPITAQLRRDKDQETAPLNEVIVLLNVQNVFIAVPPNEVTDVIMVPVSKETDQEEDLENFDCHE